MIGRMIAHMRKTSGLTQVQLSGLTGIASSTISGYEIGNSMPGYDAVEKIANACNFDLLFVDRISKETFTVSALEAQKKND